MVNSCSIEILDQCMPMICVELQNQHKKTSIGHDNDDNFIIDGPQLQLEQRQQQSERLQYDSKHEHHNKQRKKNEKQKLYKQQRNVIRTEMKKTIATFLPADAMTTTSSSLPVHKHTSIIASSHGGVTESVKEFDNYFKTCVVPLSLACDDFDNDEFSKIGKHILEAWEGMRALIVVATKSKAPTGDYQAELAPFLEQTQAAVKGIHAVRLDRDHDRHFKALTEMLACLSWVLYRAPKQLPSSIVKEAISSSDFWTNRIRKDFKDDDTHVGFCDAIKKTLTELVKYIENYHKTGLTWNPRGVSLAEATIVLGEDEDVTPATPRPALDKRLSVKALGTVAAANVSGLMSELAQRKNKEGSSAATGLRKVTKDQQTWRKEFKKGGEVKETLKVPTLEEQKMKQAAKKKEKKLTGLPICEYQERGFKWIIENHTAASAKKESENGIIKVEITDPKQQVYIYNCVGITVQITSTGIDNASAQSKFKSLVVDKCKQCNVVFQTIISSAEVVNSGRIQLQANGICPVFSIDKTNGILVWLSEESKKVSSFVCSQSSEMNVSFPDGEDQKELPIPEQFVHRLDGGVVKSDVSDLYH